MNDDFNSPIVIANLFEGLRIINGVNDGKESITASDLEILKNLYNTFVFEILGLKNEVENTQFELVDGLMQMILNQRQLAKTNKDYAASDKIRDELIKLGIVVKDGKEGSSWSIE